jgi:hypothetical protein
MVAMSIVNVILWHLGILRAFILTISSTILINNKNSVFYSVLIVVVV